MVLWRSACVGWKRQWSASCGGKRLIGPSPTPLPVPSKPLYHVSLQSTNIGCRSRPSPAKKYARRWPRRPHPVPRCPNLLNRHSRRLHPNPLLLRLPATRPCPNRFPGQQNSLLRLCQNLRQTNQPAHQNQPLQGHVRQPVHRSQPNLLNPPGKVNRLSRLVQQTRRKGSPSVRRAHPR